MDDSAINFDELEDCGWKTFKENLSLVSGHLSSRLLAEATSTVSNEQPFLDYSSFISYVAAYSLNTIPYEELVRLKRLGFGASWTVYKGVCPSRWHTKEVAIKRLNIEIPRTKSDAPAHAEELYQQLAEASLELRVLSNTLLRFHRNVVDILAVSWEDVHDDDAGDGENATWLPPKSIRPLLILELAYQQHPTLDEYVSFAKSSDQSISADIKASLLSDVADALSAVHTLKVIHGDIKPQNVLIFMSQDGSLVAKLSDFGGCYSSDDEAQLDSQLMAFTNALAGTEYWSAPEVALREHPAFTRETRDYYSLGLIALYILFEEAPFGNDDDGSYSHLERIAKLKNDPLDLYRLLLGKFYARWRLGGNQQALRSLASVKPFYDRQEKFHELYENEELFELFYGGTSWAVNRSDEFRQYSFLFVIWQFLQHDPEKRRQSDLMSDLRVFLSDRDIASTLRTIYLMQAWTQFWSVYETEGFGIWHIGTMFNDGQVTSPRPLSSQPEKEVSMAWKGPSMKRTDEFSRNFNMEQFEQLPSSLKKIFINEAHQRLMTATEPEKTHYLLMLAYCESLGYVSQEKGKMNYLLEAARLGSFLAKSGLLALSEAEKEEVDLKPQENMQWLYDTLLVRLSGKEQFINRVVSIVPTPSLHLKILRRAFESEALRTRVIRKKALKTDDHSERNKLALDFAKEGDNSGLQALLKDSPKDLLELTVDGFSLLHVATEYGHPTVIQMLVQQFDVSSNLVTIDGDPPSVLALRAHDLDTLTALLSLGADHEAVLGAHTLRCIANYGGPRALRQISYFTTLWNKTKRAREEFPLKSFLDGEFSAYEEKIPDDEPEFPPIFASILGDNIRTLWTLLVMGSSATTTTEFSSGFLAPIHVAAQLRPLHVAVLLHHGADPNQRTADKNKRTALQIACVAYSLPIYLYPRVTFASVLDDKNRLLGLQPEDYTDANMFAVQLLAGYGADVNAQDWAGMTALAHCMSDERSLPVAELLVKHLGANLGIKDFRGLSCMHRVALHQSSTVLLDFCITQGLDVNEADIHGFTPLMLAVAARNLDLVRALVKTRASLTAKQRKGWHALNIAILEGSDEAAELLFLASKDQGCFKELAKSKDLYGQTLLHQLFRTGEEFFNSQIIHFTEVVQELLGELDPMGFGLLHHAVLAGNLAAVSFLISHKIDVDLAGWHKLRPLHIACGAKFECTILLLEEARADKELKDGAGRTASDYTRLSAADPSVWERLVKQLQDERDKLVQKVLNDINKIEEDNRKKAQAKGAL